MKTKRSFLLSVLLHAGIISAAIAIATLPQEEIEEEIVLELSLAEPIPSVVQSEAIPEQKVQPIQHKTVQPTPQLPILKEAKWVEEIKPQPQIKEPIVETKPLEVPQPIAQIEPKITPLTPQPIVPQVNAEEQYLDDHLSTIRDILVKYRKYPSQAVRLKQEGTLKVTFRLKQNGEVEDVQIVSSSGYDILDEDALSLIQKSAGYFPKPPKSVRITVPLNYTLKTKTV